jgi:hypothetical protein
VQAEQLFRSALEEAVRWRQELTADSALAGVAAARALRGDVGGAAGPWGPSPLSTTRLVRRRHSRTTASTSRGTPCRRTQTDDR